MRPLMKTEGDAEEEHLERERSRLYGSESDRIHAMVMAGNHGRAILALLERIERLEGRE